MRSHLHGRRRSQSDLHVSEAILDLRRNAITVKREYQDDYLFFRKFVTKMEALMFALEFQYKSETRGKSFRQSYYNFLKFSRDAMCFPDIHSYFVLSWNKVEGDHRAVQKVWGVKYIGQLKSIDKMYRSLKKSVDKQSYEKIATVRRVVGVRPLYWLVLEYAGLKKTCRQP